ncbi:MAG: hypothetical protein IIW77_04850 [Bacteroidaceae bacterium]|nr:hypothetical protein [Bacteroidaceae bacterium]
MKKIFGTLAMALCLTAMVSCGGDKKDNNNNDQQTEQTEQTGDPIKAKVDNFYERAKAAGNDENAIMQVMSEMDAYYSSLSDADKAKFEQYCNEKPQLQ